MRKTTSAIPNNALLSGKFGLVIGSVNILSGTGPSQEDKSFPGVDNPNPFSLRNSLKCTISGGGPRSISSMTFSVSAVIPGYRISETNSFAKAISPQGGRGGVPVRTLGTGTSAQSNYLFDE